MKLFLALTALVAAASARAAAPTASNASSVNAPPQGWQPSGRLLLLPARLESAPNATQAPQESQSDESHSERLLDSGEYYVLLPDGRLQMVKYMTAALVDGSEKDTPASSIQQQQFQKQQVQSQQFQNQQFQSNPYQQQQFQTQQFQQQKFQQSSQNSQYRYLFPAESSNFQQKSEQVKQAEPAPAFYHVEYAQFPLPGSQYTQTKLQLKKDENEEEEKKSEDQKEEEKESGFEANLQFRNVKPISAPIYAYNPAPLVRILRNTE